MLPYHIRHRTFRSKFVLLATLLAGLLLPAGCRQAAETDPNSSPLALLKSVPDTPTTLPAASALFATAAAPAPLPAPQVQHAALPPRPPDADQVARQAVIPGTDSPAPRTLASPNAGLIVCNPVAGSPALSAFGSGCGRWLDLVAAGQPELGRTPLWESRARAQQEMGRTDFRLSPAQAAALFPITGATHAACGTLTGTATRCTLTYRLYALPGGKPVGPPLAQSGSEEQVLAALPAMAKALDARLGVPAPHIPPSVGLSPAGIAQFETISRNVSPSDADLLALARLSTRSPVAGMDYLDSRASNDAVLLSGMVKTLRTQLPGNALVLAHIGYANPSALRPYAAATQALITRYPASALLAHTEVWQQRIWGTRAGELKASQRAVRDAPRDPETWLALGYTLGDVAEDLRQSRPARDISAADWAVLKRLYPQQEAADLRATALDPRDGHAWLRLAEAATVEGDTARADGALAKALSLDLDKREVYSWGLQMYQPKWGGDPQMLARITALAAAEPWNDSTGAIGTAENLRSARRATEADEVLSGFIARQRVRIAKTPSDALLHWNLAAALAVQKTAPALREASLEYRIAAHLMPNAPSIHRWLGDVLDRRGRQTEAIAEYQRAAALDPFESSTRFALGYDLKHEHQFPEALSELRLAMRLNPRNADAHYGLGELLSMQHQYKPAAAEYREAIRMAYYSLGAWLSLPTALDQCGQYDASLAAGREADHILTEQARTDAETELPIHDTMSDDYLHKKDWERSIAESNVSLGYNANDACAHENLAEAYMGRGDKKEAQAEWAKTIALGDPVITPVARKLLAAYP